MQTIIIIAIITVILSIFAVTIQILNLRDLIEINQYLKAEIKKELQEASKEYEETMQREKSEREKALSEFPEWAEEFINNYLAVSQKSNRDQ